MVDLVLCLGALYHVEPVPARALGILGCEDLDPIPVFDLIVDGYQLPVYPCADHAVAHRTVNAVGKVNGRGAGRKILHLAAGCKAVNAVRKQIQVAL